MSDSCNILAEEMLEAITKAHFTWAHDPSNKGLFERLLDSLLSLTGSEYGFIGEILKTKDGIQYLKAHAVTNIAWDAATLKFYEDNASQGLEFHNLNTLFGYVIRTGEPVISNSPSTDHRRGGLPQGHPPLNCFMGLPFTFNDEMIGMVGVANRKQGYDNDLAFFLRPFLATCANIIYSKRQETLRVRAEGAVREKETRLRAVMDSVLDAIITVTEDGIIESVNPATLKLFGYTEEELVGHKVNMLMPEPYRSEHDTYIRNYIVTGNPRVIGKGREAVGRRKDGTEFPMDLGLTEVWLDPSSRRFTGIIRDISRRKEMDEKLKDVLVKLTKSRNNLLVILNQLRVATIIVEETGSMAFISDSFSELAGIDKKSLIGSRWDTALSFDTESAEKLKNAMGLRQEERKRELLEFYPSGKEKKWLEFEIKDDPTEHGRKIIYLYDVSEIRNLREKARFSRFGELIGHSTGMLRLYDSIERVARGDWTVMIDGETGSGKELVARTIHAKSARCDAPFIAVNCAGLTESLLSSQLFGHRKGAFTGAISDQKGFFEEAEGGTIFLDEIGDIPMPIQTAMLRVIQEMEITRLGETRPRKINVRILVATHKDLERETSEGRFRQDLFYRIRVARINVPSLRTRKEDIPLLISSFMEKYSMMNVSQIPKINNQAMKMLMEYRWPGNVRELRNFVDYIFINASSDTVMPEDLPPEITRQGSEMPYPVRGSALPTGFLEKDEKEKILEAIRRANGNRSQAAKLLGMGRATLYRRFRELGIESD